MITTVTPEMLINERIGKNYWTIPGCNDMDSIKVEMLKDCIERIFKVSLDGKRGKRNIVYARHLFRYILSHIGIKGDWIDTNRSKISWTCKKTFMYSQDEIAELTGCLRSNVFSSVKTASGLIETDKSFRYKAEKIIRKIEFNLIVLPKN
jgi:hypothetical protein